MEMMDQNSNEIHSFLLNRQCKTNTDTTYTDCFPSPTHKPRAPNLGQVSSQSADVPHSFTPFTDCADVCECLGLCGCTTCSVHKAGITTAQTLNPWSNPLSVPTICRAKKFSSEMSVHVHDKLEKKKKKKSKGSRGHSDSGRSKCCLQP